MTPTPSDLLALSDKATPGEFQLWTSCSWRRICTTSGEQVLTPCVDKDGHPNMDCGPDYVNAEFLIAAANWFRSQDWSRPSLSAQAVGDGWISVSDRLPAERQPVLVSWTRAPWLTKPTPYVYMHAVCREDAGDEMWIWAEWQGEPFPVGDDCEWDAETQPTHWMPLPPAPGTTPPQPADGGGSLAELLAAAADVLKPGEGDKIVGHDPHGHPLNAEGVRRWRLRAALAKFQPAGGES